MAQAKNTQLTIIQPDDWHLHLRDGAVLANVLPHTVRRFRRAIIMPNLNPPVTTVAAAEDYRKRIKKESTEEGFEPLMTLYLHPKMKLSELSYAKKSAMIYGIKLYPAGATTHSEWGVRDIEMMYPLFAKMEELALPLLVHGEVADENVDVFEREKYFIQRHLEALVKEFSSLKIVLEHISTAEGVAFVCDTAKTVAGTITAHHLLLNRNAIFAKGRLRPHHYCLPVLKHEKDRQALLAAVSSGNPKFFLGTDSAPHDVNAKENACGCAGIYTAHFAIELYAEIFDQHGILDKLEGFASRYGAAFYGLPVNTTRIQLIKKESKVPPSFALGEGSLIPLRAGESVAWSLVE